MADFTEHELGDLVRFDMTGRLDSAAVAPLEAPFTAKLRAANQSVLLDLSAVPFIGSLAIRMLVAAARVLERGGHQLMLTGAQPAVSEVLETVSISDIIPLVGSVHEARERLGQPT